MVGFIVSWKEKGQSLCYSHCTYINSENIFWKKTLLYHPKVSLHWYDTLSFILGQKLNKRSKMSQPNFEIWKEPRGFLKCLQVVSSISQLQFRLPRKLVCIFKKVIFWSFVGYRKYKRSIPSMCNPWHYYFSVSCSFRLLLCNGVPREVQFCAEVYGCSGRCCHWATRRNVQLSFQYSHEPRHDVAN